MSLLAWVLLIAVWVVVLINSLVLVGLLRMVFRLQDADQTGKESEVGLRTGQKAPSFSAVDLIGNPVSTESLMGRTTGLLFVSPNCPSCIASLDEMDALRRKADGNVVVICRAKHGECIQLAETYGIGVPTVADDDNRISRLFGVAVNPTAVIIGEDGRVRSYGHPMRGEEFDVMFEKAGSGQTLEVG